MNKKLYIVVHGKTPGIYTSKDTYLAQTRGVSGLIAKSFKSLSTAIAWLRKNDTKKIIKESDVQKAFNKLEKATETKPVPPTTEKPALSPILEIKRTPLKIYSDGSILGEHHNAGGWAGIVVIDDKIQLRISGYKKSSKSLNSNEIELYAMYKTIQYLKKHHWNLNDAMIYTDAKYILDQWLKNIRPNDANKKIWKKLWKILIQYHISVYWIKGHSGNIYNEECDKLAGKAAKEKLAITKEKK